MAGDDKKTKTTPAPKTESAPAAKADVAPAAKTVPDAKTEPDAKSSSYSRGEGQKPVTQAYKDNWNAIFAKNKKKKKR